MRRSPVLIDKRRHDLGAILLKSIIQTSTIIASNRRRRQRGVLLN